MTITVTGTLVGDIMYFGGEGPGWAIDTDEGPRVEADVTQVAAQAAQLKGTKVSASGEMRDVEYIERGIVPTLFVESLRSNVKP